MPNGQFIDEFFSILVNRFHFISLFNSSIKVQIRKVVFKSIVPYLNLITQTNYQIISPIISFNRFYV